MLVIGCSPVPPPKESVAVQPAAVPPQKPVKPRPKVATQPTVKVAAIKDPQPAPARGKPRPVDEARVLKAGLRKVVGMHLTLYTDLPSSPAVDGLVDVFDLAYPEWCRYFEVKESSGGDVWHMHGFLMVDKARFEAAGLIPAELPQFRHGFAIAYDLWLNEQPNDYYRRHLLLHEGAHSFMSTQLGGCGPPWYSEGLAELLATHRFENGKLTLGYFPQRREDVPQLGRIKLVREAVAQGKMLSVEDVLNYGPTAHLSNEPYAWCWALAAMLDGHPRYQVRFRALKAEVTDNVTASFRRTFASDWDQLSDEWQVFAANLEYGDDLVRSAIEFASGKPPSSAGTRVKVAADRGWQSSGIRLEVGQTYRLRASGRFQLGQQPQIWWSEANGVSLRYYAGQPLGILLAAVRPEAQRAGQPSCFLQPQVVGLETTLRPTEAGTLYLMINDSPAERADNIGSPEVSVTADR
jgi:hypothetical protein